MVNLSQELFVDNLLEAALTTFLMSNIFGTAFPVSRKMDDEDEGASTEDPASEAEGDTYHHETKCQKEERTNSCQMN